MHAHAQKGKVKGPEEISCCVCRQSQQEHKQGEGERTSLPIPGAASSELRRKFAKCFFTDVQESKPA